MSVLALFTWLADLTIQPVLTLCTWGYDVTFKHVLALFTRSYALDATAVSVGKRYARTAGGLPPSSFQLDLSRFGH